MKLPALAIAIVLAALAGSGCGKKKEEVPSPGSTEGTKAGRRPEPQREDPPVPEPAPEPPEAPDPVGLLAGLTSENALEIREQLRADARVWKGSIGPFYRKWAEADPEAAMAAARGEDPKLRLASTSMALAGWTMNDPRAARDWFDAEMTAPHQLRFAHALVDRWPADDLEDLAVWTERFDDGREKTNLVTRMAGTWLRNDASSAAQWLSTLPTGEARNRATDYVFQAWGKDDPTAAGDYLAANINNANNDVAISAYAKAVVPDDPEAAVLWAQEIADPGLREEILKAIPQIRANPDGSPVNFPGQ